MPSSKSWRCVSASPVHFSSGFVLTFTLLAWIHPYALSYAVLCMPHRLLCRPDRIAGRLAHCICLLARPRLARPWLLWIHIPIHDNASPRHLVHDDTEHPTRSARSRKPSCGERDLRADGDGVGSVVHHPDILVSLAACGCRAFPDSDGKIADVAGIATTPR